MHNREGALVPSLAPLWRHQLTPEVSYAQRNDGLEQSIHGLAKSRQARAFKYGPWGWAL